MFDTFGIPCIKYMQKMYIKNNKYTLKIKANEMHYL